MGCASISSASRSAAGSGSAGGGAVSISVAGAAGSESPVGCASISPASWPVGPFRLVGLHGYGRCRGPWAHGRHRDGRVRRRDRRHRRHRMHRTRGRHRRQPRTIRNLREVRDLRIRRRTVRRRDRDVRAVRRLRDGQRGALPAHPRPTPVASGGRSVAADSCPTSFGCGLGRSRRIWRHTINAGHLIGDRGTAAALIGRVWRILRGVVLGHLRGPSYCSREPWNSRAPCGTPCASAAGVADITSSVPAGSADGEAGSAHRVPRAELGRAHRATSLA